MAFNLSSLLSGLRTPISVKGKSRKQVLGVDIGSSSIKVVQVKNHGGVPTLETYGELQLGPYGDVEIGRKTNLSVERAIQAFSDIVQESSVTTKNVALAMPYSSSFVTFIIVPDVDDEKLESMVRIEARKYIPVSITDVTLDWFSVPLRRDSKHKRLMLAAIHNDALSRNQSVITRAGYLNNITEIELFSTSRATVSPKDKAVVIIDIGASTSKLYLVTNSIVSLTHSVRMSMSDVTSALSKELEIEFDKAEELKRQNGLNGKNEDVNRILRNELQRGFVEFRQVIARHKTDEHIDVDKIILSGGGALLDGITTYTQDILQTPTVLAEPFAKVSYPAFLEDTLKEAGPTFSVAIGAALRALDE